MSPPSESPDSEAQRKARRALYLLYLAMAVGIVLPGILFLIFGIER